MNTFFRPFFLHLNCLNAIIQCYVKFSVMETFGKQNAAICEKTLAFMNSPDARVKKCVRWFFQLFLVIRPPILINNIMWGLKIKWVKDIKLGNMTYNTELEISTFVIKQSFTASRIIFFMSFRDVQLKKTVFSGYRDDTLDFAHDVVPIARDTAYSHFVT